MIPGDMPSFFPVESLFQNTDDSRFPSTTSPSVPGFAQDFRGVTSGVVIRRSMSFSGVDLSDREMQVDDEMSEDSGPLGEKKKRLSSEQVKALEKSFELGSKLEPERKMQLARSLGLQPRQVAIWFQNRRARWKTKQMERDYEHLKRQFEVLKADNEVLRAQNKQFHSELMALKSRESSRLGPINLNKENDASWSNGSETSIDVNLGIKGSTSIESGVLNANSQVQPSPRPVFPSGIEQPGVTHLLQDSVRTDLQGPGIDQQQPTSDGGLSNMFNSVEEQPSFWPWPEHSNFR